MRRKVKVSVQNIIYITRIYKKDLLRKIVRNKKKTR